MRGVDVDRRARRAWPAPRRAPARASRGRARRARSRLRRRRTARAPRPRSARTRARPAQQLLRPREVAELRHRDAAQRERRRVVAQRDALQRAERIARRERPRRGRDQRVHRNPATLVTPTVAMPAAQSIPRRPRPSHGTLRTLTGRQTMATQATSTTHRIGTREEWLAARLELLEAEKDADAAQRRAGAAAAGAALGARWTRTTDSTPTRGAPRSRTSSAGARSCSSTTSCSGPTTRRAARPARAIADGFNGIAVHLANHDVTLWRCRGRRSRSCRRTSGAWAGRFPWASSLDSDFNLDFNVALHRGAAARRAASSTTTGARPGGSCALADPAGTAKGRSPRSRR